MLKHRLQTADCADHADFAATQTGNFSFFYLDLLKVCLDILFTFCSCYSFLEARHGSGKKSKMSWQ